jgi:hypothetical protein
LPQGKQWGFEWMGTIRMGRTRLESGVETSRMGPVGAGMEGWRSNGRVEVERFGRDAIEYGSDCSGDGYVRFAG